MNSGELAGRLIGDWRRETGTPQRDVAAMLGVPDQTIHHMEVGHRKTVPVELMMKILLLTGEPVSSALRQVDVDLESSPSVDWVAMRIAKASGRTLSDVQQAAQRLFGRTATEEHRSRCGAAASPIARGNHTRQLQKELSDVSDLTRAKMRSA